MRIVLTVLLILSACPLWGQFSMEAYLGRSRYDVDLQSFQSVRDYIDNSKFRSPLLREVEVRLRENQNQDGIDDYRLRFSPI